MVAVVLGGKLLAVIMATLSTNGLSISHLLENRIDHELHLQTWKTEYDKSSSTYKQIDLQKLLLLSA